MNKINKFKTLLSTFLVLAVLAVGCLGVIPAVASAAPQCDPGYTAKLSNGVWTCVKQPGGVAASHPTGDTCGDSKHGGPVYTDFNFGCEGKGNPIMDLVFAVVRFLSTGVGFVLVASMVWAGIQYTSSRGDPQATARAIQRVRSNVIALLLFIFAYAILNFVVPGAVLG